jgi:uncharacterized protein (TIGR00369 family)
VWKQWLDAIANGTATPPPVVTKLGLPPIEGWEPGRVWGSWKLDPDLLNAAGSLFGGYLAALADSFTGLAMMSAIADDEWFTTSDLRVSYFRPVTGGTLDIAAEVVNRGRRQAHCECVFVNDRDKVVAKATATQVIQPLGEADFGKAFPPGDGGAIIGSEAP